jgi:glycosyltransferase involved in cell wall biosynthesis
VSVTAQRHGEPVKAVGRGTRVIVVGPMLGGQAGHVPFVGEALASRLTRRGYSVMRTSARRRRAARFADITATLVRHSADVDVQILQVYGGLSFVAEDVASALGTLFGQKIIMHLHGGAMPAFMARHPIWARRVLSRAAAVVVPSAFLRAALAPFRDDVHVIPNAVDVAAYPYRHRTELRPRLFWMRTFHDVYNPELAIRAFARVRRAHPEATLVMAGQDKGTRLQAQRCAERLSVQDGIRFAGFLDAAAKMREGAAADIFLNTNRIDNTPVSVIEACAWGVPVVATNVGGLPALLTHDENGLLVPDDDDEAMAASILRLLRDPHLAGRISRQARALAESCSWERTTPQWERLLHDVVTA